MKPRLMAALVAVALGTAACSPGSYPVDIFPEMHYSPSQALLEPNRLSAPANAVPITGGRANIPYSQAAGQTNPLAAGSPALAQGPSLYAMNCAMCHGNDGHGDGPVAKYFQQRGTDVVPVPPPDFRGQLVRSYNDGQLHWIVDNGLGNMPAFNNLLTDDQTWAVVAYVKEMQARP